MTQCTPSRPSRLSLAVLALAVLAAALSASCKSAPAPKPEVPVSHRASAHSVVNKPPTLPGKALSLERIYADPPLAGAPPIGLSFAPSGKWLGFLKGSDGDSQVLDLWAFPLTDSGAGKPVPLVRTDDILAGHKAQLSEAERMANERKRISHQGITSYKWCGDEGKAILFPLSGALYHVALPQSAGDKVVVTKLAEKADAPRLNATCSPKGSFISFVYKGDLHLIDVKTQQERALTTGATATKTRGLAEFVAQEEMARYVGAWISPDESRIAYLEVDQSGVSTKIRPRIYADRTEMFEQRYPAAGEANAKVRLFVVDVKTGRSKAIALPKALNADHYIARVGWTPAKTKVALTVQWQSRDQKRLVLLYGQAPQFKLREVHDEKDPAWVELHDDLRVLKDGEHYIWPSEQSGVRQLYLRSLKDDSAVALTAGIDPVLRLVGVQESVSEKGKEKLGRIYFTKATERSLQKQLFSAPLDVTQRGDVAPSQTQITQGHGTHQVTLSPSKTHFVDSHSSWAHPARVSLHTIDGKEVAVLDDNPAKELHSFVASQPSFEMVKAEDGTELNALVMPPVVVQPGEKYPVVVYVYGGPTAQVVTDAFTHLYPYFVHLTQRGFGVFMIDNRGSGNRDRKFTRSIENRFGDIELVDQQAGIAWLKKNIEWVDGNRVGIWGWSYGGYMSALSIFDNNSPYAAAAAVAPVTDWTLYDTHYTERYIGTPQGNPSVYKKAAVVPQAKNLKRPFLLLHGMADDNVLFENSLALISALQNDSLPFEMMVYPGRAHSLRGRGTRLHVFRTITRFFERQLHPNVPLTTEAASEKRDGFESSNK